LRPYGPGTYLHKRRNNVNISRIMAVALAFAGALTAVTLIHVPHSSLVPVAYAQSGCSDSTLRGNYGFQINGNIIGLGPIGGVALVTYDGTGNFTQTDNVNINGGGIPILNTPGSGTYSVNHDCTGTLTLNSGGRVTHSAFVIVGNGKQILDVGTDPHVVITGVGKAVGSVDNQDSN
jgi:hypothetical protein